MLIYRLHVSLLFECLPILNWNNLFKRTYICKIEFQFWINFMPSNIPKSHEKKSNKKGWNWSTEQKLWYASEKNACAYQPALCVGLVWQTRLLNTLNHERFPVYCKILRFSNFLTFAHAYSLNCHKFVKNKWKKCPFGNVYGAQMSSDFLVAFKKNFLHYI